MIKFQKSSINFKKIERHDKGSADVEIRKPVSRQERMMRQKLIDSN